MSVVMMKQRVRARREERELGAPSKSHWTHPWSNTWAVAAGESATKTPRRWLTGKEIAAHLGASEYWVMEKARQGILPSHKVAHLRFFLLEEVEDAILAL